MSGVNDSFASSLELSGIGQENDVNYNTPHPLHFDKEGNFRILTLSDIHGRTDHDVESSRFILDVVNATKPNLIVLLGDQISYVKNQGDNVKNAIKNIMDTIAQTQVPFAVVFGNHDIDCMPLDQQMKIFQSYPTCLGRPSMTLTDTRNFDISNINEEDPTKDVIFDYEKESVQCSGCGNYNLLIKDSKNEKFVFNLWFLDSGNVDSIFVKPDQVEWYDKEYQKIITEVHNYNEKVEQSKNPNHTPSSQPRQLHSLWFMHRSVDEVYDFFNTSDFPTNTTAVSKGYRFGYYLTLNKDPQFRYDPTGVFLEGPELPEYKDNVSDLYSHWVRNGDVLGACFGHDHGNSFYGFTKDNIGLGFDSAAGFLHAYPFPGVERGARIFDLNENDTSSFSTQMVYASQVMGDRRAGFLERMITHGHFNAAIKFAKTTLMPRPLQKVVGRKIQTFLIKKFCPKPMRSTFKFDY